MLHTRDLLQGQKIILIELVDTDNLLIHLKALSANHQVEISVQGGHTRIDLLKIEGMNQPLEESVIAPPSTDVHFEDIIYNPKLWPEIIDSL